MEVGRIGESREETKDRDEFQKLSAQQQEDVPVGMPERCSPERIRFAALTRVLACSAPFRQILIRDGRLRREHLSDSGARLEKKKYIDSVGLLMEVADNPL